MYSFKIKPDIDRLEQFVRRPSGWDGRELVFLPCEDTLREVGITLLDLKSFSTDLLKFTADILPN